MIKAPESCKVYTPKPLAEAMVAALDSEELTRWLEPCVGNGVFLSALSNGGVRKHQIIALDLDVKKHNDDSFARTIRGVETLSWLQHTKNKFDRIIGNPPFVPLHDVHPAIQTAARNTIIPWTEKKVPLGANTWFAFLCGILTVLRAGGSFAFILPSSWEYADYAAALRSVICQKFARFYTLRCKKPLFTDVQEGSVVLVGLGCGLPHQASARIECESLDHLCQLLIEISYHHPEDKICSDPPCNYDSQGTKTLCDFVDIRIGGVTGHSRYFILTESERRERSLPVNACLPVVSRARHIRSAAIDQDIWNDLVDQDERIWLFRPNSSALENKNVKRYLNLRRVKGGCDKSRYKVSIRNPWYVTPLPKNVDGFISGMHQYPPFISFRNMPRLNATNTLYTVRFKKKMTEDERYSLALILLSTPVLSQINQKIRCYASGLEKLEPSDLATLRLPIFRPIRKARQTYCAFVNEIVNRSASDFSKEIDRTLKL